MAYYTLSMLMPFCINILSVLYTASALFIDVSSLFSEGFFLIPSLVWRFAFNRQMAHHSYKRDDFNFIKSQQLVSHNGREWQNENENEIGALENFFGTANVVRRWYEHWVIVLYGGFSCIPRKKCYQSSNMKAVQIITSDLWLCSHLNSLHFSQLRMTFN